MRDCQPPLARLSAGGDRRSPAGRPLAAAAAGPPDSQAVPTTVGLMVGRRRPAWVEGSLAADGRSQTSGRASVALQPVQPSTAMPFTSDGELRTSARE